MRNHDHERNRLQWREMYEARVKKVLGSPGIRKKYFGKWDYKLAFYIRESALLESIPENGAIYRCSYWNGPGGNPSKFMGSIIVTAESELAAHLEAGRIANLSGSPLITDISVKELPPNLAMEGDAEAEQLRSALQSQNGALIMMAKQLMALFLGQQIDRDGPRSLFLGSIVLHIPMDENPTKYIEAILDAFPLKVYYHIETLGFFLERWCRYGYGVRYTERRMMEEHPEIAKLPGHQFSFDGRIWDRRFKDLITWKDPRRSFQDRYMYKNEAPIIKPPAEVLI